MSKHQVGQQHKKIIKRLWILLVFSALGAVLFLCLLSWGVFGYMPAVEELQNPKSKLASQIVSSNNVVLGNIYYENRIEIKYNELSAGLVNSLVATEDERFFNHSGVDFKGVVRAVAFLGRRGGASTITQQLARMLFEDRDKNFLKAVLQKLKEWIIAVKLERCYTKQEIVAMYFNRVDFVNHAVGIKSASSVYFNSTPEQVKIEEAAVIVGMLKNPSLYNPLTRPEITEHRRNVVMSQMMKNGFLTKVEYDSLKVIPLELNYRKADYKSRTASYFQQEIRKELKRILTEKDENTGEYLLNAKGEQYNMYKDGLRIYTTIDSRMQEYAERAIVKYLGQTLQKQFHENVKNNTNTPFSNTVNEDVVDRSIKRAIKQSSRYKIYTGKQCGYCGRGANQIETFNNEAGKKCYRCIYCKTERESVSGEFIEKMFNTKVSMNVFSWEGSQKKTMTPVDSIKYYKSLLQTGFIAIDPNTGHIKAWVGGIDKKSFAYDHVRQSKRQVGSTFKPILYAYALDAGLIEPCESFPNIHYSIPKGKFGLTKEWKPGYDPQFEGMINYKFGLACSMNNVAVKVMSKCRPANVVDFAHNLGIVNEIEAVPSIALGTCDLSLYEMVNVYSTLANKGVWIEPSFITRIEDKYGNVIVNLRPEVKNATSEETAYTILKMMEGVADGVYNEDLGATRSTAKRRLRGDYKLKFPIACKTGTTQDNSDGWFIGITNELVAGVWVGADDRSVRFSTTRLGQGAHMALPIWALFMKSVSNDKSIDIAFSQFDIPKKAINIDCSSQEEENVFFDP